MTLQFSQAGAYHRNLSPDLWFELENQGIPGAIIHARLIGWDGEHVTIPVFSRDRKLLCFEYAAFDENGRLVVLPHDRERPYLYGEPILNLNPQEIAVTEGVIESLILSGQGFNALSTTGDRLSFQEEWAPVLRKVPNVFLCFKRRSDSIQAALGIREFVPQARIVTLPPEVGQGGLYEFFVELEATAADFRQLLKRAADSSDA
jgi:hypothetical protein